MTVPEERFLSTEEVAERLQVDEQTVRRWIKSGKLEAFKPGREWRISPAAFEALLESYSSPKALPRPEFSELPGLSAALVRHGVSRREHAFRAGMSPHEILDYEIGAKKPTAEIIDRLADALRAKPYELTSSPKQVEARLAEEEQENARIAKELKERDAIERFDERANPEYRTMRDAYEKTKVERQNERDREDKLA